MASQSKAGLGVALLGLAFVLAALRLIYHQGVQWWKGRSYGKVPAPPMVPWWDILGLTFSFAFSKAIAEDQLLEYTKAMRVAVEEAEGRKVTTTQLSMLGKKAFTTTDPKNIQAVLAHQFNDFGLGQDRIGSLLPMLGVGIFASDGSAWQHSRTMLRPSFAKMRLEDLDLEEKHGRNLLQAFPATEANGWIPEFDIQPFFYKLTMDSSTEFFFGESSHTLLAQRDSPETRFVDAFDRGQHFIAQRATAGPYYWLMTSSAFRADCKTVHEWTDACVDRALTRYDEKQGLKTTDKNSQYIFLHELIAQTKDRVALRSQLLNVLVAGRDTTAGLLSWVFLHLSRHPEQFEKLRSTILHSFGTYESPNDITFTTLKNCKPLQNLLREVLRLHPGVPINIRQALKDTTLPQGGGSSGKKPVFVPQGSQIFYSVYWLHRDRNLWGDDANEFKPDRWNAARPGWEYLPFNGGPRICLGQMLALTSAGYAVVRLLQRFDGIRTTDWRDLKTRVSLTAQSANGVHLSFHRTEPTEM